LVGDVSVQQHFGGDAMVYATYSRGYKPKAYNTVHDFITLQNETNAAYADAHKSDLAASQAVAQEHINDFEIGFKGSLLEHTLTFDAAAFYTKYDGYQVQIFDTSQVIGVLRLANGAARTDGIEVDTHWRPSSNTMVSLSAAYINATITSFKGANAYPTQNASGFQDLSGHPLPDSPKFKFNGSAEQVFPMTQFDALIGGDLSYRSSAMLQADGNPQTNQPGFALINLHIGVRSKDQKVSATLFVNNLTDHFYLTDAEDFFSGAFGFGPPGPTGFGPANVVVGQPARDSHRYFGGRVAVKF
jgi:iron complex outermembrane receptor protein